MFRFRSVPMIAILDNTSRSFEIATFAWLLVSLLTFDIFVSTWLSRSTDQVGMLYFAWGG